MSVSRKRYRPLDPAEERSVNSTQLLQIGILEDERSYCFSWPEAPLSMLLNRANKDNSVVKDQPQLPIDSKGDLSSGTSSGGPVASVSLPHVYRLRDEGQESSMLHLAHLVSSQKYCTTIGKMGTSTFCTRRNSEQSAPVMKAHAAAPMGTLSAAEDSTFSLSSSQVADAERIGLIDAMLQTLGQISPNAVREELFIHARQLIEIEVTGLEWRAHIESQRTAAALHRLLSLPAAVPFLPLNRSDDDAWRLAVHSLWLRWRMNSCGCSAALDDSHSISIQRSVSAPSHPWGAPLLPGAFLHGVQSDYFIHPPQLSNASPHSSGPGVNNSHAAEDIRLAHSTSRRRGAYNFLRWRLDVYLPRLRSAAGPSDEEVRGTSGSAFLHSGSNRSVSGLMTVDDIDGLVRGEVLSRPLVEVTMDTARTEAADPLSCLECTDLKRDTDTWRGWLSKVV